MRDLFRHYRPAAEQEAEAELSRLMRQVDAAALRAAARGARPRAPYAAQRSPYAAAARRLNAAPPAALNPSPPPAQLTARDLIDPRIDVAAQRVLLQLASLPQARSLAGGFLDAVRGGRLTGIYKQDQRAPALLARQLNLGWWQLIPKGEHAVLVLDPSNLLSAPPLVAFSLAAANVPSLLAPALGKAWESFDLWFSGRAQFCPAAPLQTTVQAGGFTLTLPNIVPQGFCGPPPAPPNRIEAAVDKLRKAVGNRKLVSGGQFYMSDLLDEAVKGGEKSFGRAPLSGSDIFNHLWNSYVADQKPATDKELKDIFDKDKLELTAQQSKNLLEHELSRCFEVTGKVIRLILRKKAWPGEQKRATGRVSFSRGNLSLRGERQTGRGYVVVYVGTLADRIQQVKDALDDGHLIEAGVVSGIDPDAADPLGNPEHFILVFGYDADRFVFWDPDANASGATQFGTGFGFLFFDRTANRFTTAASDADMAVNSKGDHANGQHRYQVITLQARPGAT